MCVYVCEKENDNRNCVMIFKAYHNVRGSRFLFFLYSKYKVNLKALITVDAKGADNITYVNN